MAPSESCRLSIKFAEVIIFIVLSGPILGNLGNCTYSTHEILAILSLFLPLLFSLFLSSSSLPTSPTYRAYLSLQLLPRPQLHLATLNFPKKFIRNQLTWFLRVTIQPKVVNVTDIKFAQKLRTISHVHESKFCREWKKNSSILKKWRHVTKFLLTVILTIYVLRFPVRNISPTPLDPYKAYELNRK